MMDFDGDGIVGAKEFRYNCITRIAVENIQVVDEAFDKLLDVCVNLPLSIQIIHSLSFDSFPRNRMKIDDEAV